MNLSEITEDLDALEKMGIESIELTCHWDADAAQSDFDDLLTRIGSNGRNDEIWSYEECHDLGLLDLEPCSERDIRYACWSTCSEHYSFRDLVADKMRYDSWRDYFECERLTIEDFVRGDVEIPKGAIEKVEVFNVTGHSQSHFATVLYPTENKSEQWDSSAIHEYLCHTFYDQPLRAVLEIDGDDYFLEPSDCYDYDQDEIVDLVTTILKGLNFTPEQIEAIQEFTRKSLPEFPETY